MIFSWVVNPVHVRVNTDMTEEQDHIDEVLNTGVQSTTSDGQSTNFVSPSELRKRARELDEAEAKTNGVAPKRPLFNRIRIW